MVEFEYAPDPYQHSTVTVCIPMLSKMEIVKEMESPVVPELGVVSAIKVGRSLSLMLLSF